MHEYAVMFSAFYESELVVSIFFTVVAAIPFDAPYIAAIGKAVLVILTFLSQKYQKYLIRCRTIA